VWRERVGGRERKGSPIESFQDLAFLASNLIRLLWAFVGQKILKIVTKLSIYLILREVKGSYFEKNQKVIDTVRLLQSSSWVYVVCPKNGKIYKNIIWYDSRKLNVG